MHCEASASVHYFVKKSQAKRNVLLLRFLRPAAVGGAFAALPLFPPLATSVFACEADPPFAMSKTSTKFANMQECI